jgi:hypothetical protein
MGNNREALLPYLFADVDSSAVRMRPSMWKGKSRPAQAVENRGRGLDAVVAFEHQSPRPAIGDSPQPQRGSGYQHQVSMNDTILGESWTPSKLEAGVGAVGTGRIWNSV